MNEPDRVLRMNELLRYGRPPNRQSSTVDGLPNFYYLTDAPGLDVKLLQLEAGINSAQEVRGPTGPRRPVVCLRSSPWKAGHVTNPWHDEFDLDHGHVLYYGDHKPGMVGFPGDSSGGNRELLEVFKLHSAPDRASRVKAPPLLLFMAVSRRLGGRTTVKGHVTFCGIAVIERVEHTLQRDPATGESFPNLRFDLAVLELDRNGDELNTQWLADRRNDHLTAEQTLAGAPESWHTWVTDGASALSRIRRRVRSARIRSRDDQGASTNSVDEAVLDQVYHFFDDNKHAFELLASWIAEQVFIGRGAAYTRGWLSQAGGDGGLDFVGKLDVGSSETSTPLVVLGQAKCVRPDSSISADQVARLVARLRRGWIGVFVTTGFYSTRAQAEVIDDEYPIVLVAGGDLAQQVRRLADRTTNGDVAALLQRSMNEYPQAVVYRRPEEVLAM